MLEFLLIITFYKSMVGEKVKPLAFDFSSYKAYAQTLLHTHIIFICKSYTNSNVICLENKWKIHLFFSLQNSHFIF